MMRVLFVCHSSFVVELDQSVLIFDYYGEGRLPAVSRDKQVYFLNSHGHPDHFKREILELRERYPKAEYILSRDIYFRREDRREWIHSVKAREDYELGELKFHTLRSTDMGVAFVVETEGKRIYHAGDLNWWHWEGEDKAWNHNMAANYRNEVDRLKGQHFHAAFVPIDPRLSEAYYGGIRYFLEQTDAEHVFPMHFWGKYELCTKLAGQPEMAGLLSHYHPIGYQGQEWNLC